MDVKIEFDLGKVVDRRRSTRRTFKVERRRADSYIRLIGLGNEGVKIPLCHAEDIAQVLEECRDTDENFQIGNSETNINIPGSIARRIGGFIKTIGEYAGENSLYRGPLRFLIIPPYQ